MKALQDLEVFTQTADLGSLSAAARALDMTPAAASAAIKRLEAELQVLLFVRSTRSLHLTQEGELFLSHCRIALNTLQDASQRLTQKQAISGILRITAPSDLGRNHLLAWLIEFNRRYPNIRYHLTLTDRNADLYS